MSFLEKALVCIEGRSRRPGSMFQMDQLEARRKKAFARLGDAVRRNIARGKFAALNMPVNYRFHYPQFASQVPSFRI